MRPLSTKEPLHLVFKANSIRIRGGFRTSKRFQLIHHLLQKYALKFHIKVEQISVQGDHLHLLIRTRRRSQFQNFFRVFAGQIAQRMEKSGLLTESLVTDAPRGGVASVAPGQEPGDRKAQKPNSTLSEPRGLWLYRPFSRVVRGWRAYRTVRNYIQLNEKESMGEIPYRAERLKGLSNSEWEILWS
jgi:REP element-mobilizing transposase RayT